jgi:hypothetical protein
VGIQCASVLLSIAVVNIELMPKIKAAQREQLGLNKHKSDSKQGQMSGWAAASSKSVYSEVVKVRASPIIFSLHDFSLIIFTLGSSVQYIALSRPACVFGACIYL